MEKRELQILNILILTLVLACGLFGQTTKKIFGNVYDFNSNSPLVGANILIDGTGLGSSTDEFGYFQFDNLYTGSYSITTSYVGYETQTFPDQTVFADQPTEINIYLKPSKNKLNDVIVTNHESNTKGSIKFYTQEDIAKSNFQSVAEVLEQTPGVEIQSTGGVGSSKKISIRGSGTNQVLVMLDDVSLNNQFGGDADLSQVPINIVERIEVYEGGSSSKFGSGAIGGAINIITKQNFKNEYKINVIGGSFGLINVEPSISGNIRNLSYFLSYNFIQSDGNYPYAYQNTSGVESEAIRINSDMKSQNIFTRINYKLDNYLFSVNAQKLESDRGLPGKTKALTAYARSKNNNTMFGSKFRAAFDNFVLDLNGSYSQNITENSNLYPDYATPEYTKYPTYHYKYESDVAVLNTTLYYKLIEWLNVTAGYNGKRFSYNDENFLAKSSSSIINATETSNGVFLHQEFKLDLPKPLNKFLVSPSIRYDEMRMSNGEINRSENQWSPSASLYLSVGEKHQLYFKSSISRSFRVPTFSDLFYQDVRIEGKTDLLPEKSLNKEIGLGWEINKWGKLKGEINLYNYSIEDMIVWKLGSFEVFRPFNSDAEISGQVYSIDYQLPKHNLSLQLSYTYLQPLNKNKQETTYNKIIPYSPQHSFKSGLQFGYKEFTGIINYRIVGKRFVTVANTVELSPYDVMDITMLQNIRIENFQIALKFSVNNITNKLYEIVSDYPMPGREFRLGITLMY
ncbi:MAG: TonB-dependent receptor [Melioribacteraceae bacterium]|jgi:vitamin B12 transporter|nr:TonB-dependent receptor [Melioribacteraceae bacterium]